MELKFNVQGEVRKTFVTEVGAIIGCGATYQGAPSFGYMVSNLTIDRFGTLVWDERTDSETIRHLLEQLIQRGYTAEGQEALLAELALAEPEPATDNVCIEYPLEGFTPEALDNLEKLAASKAPLIKKALGAEELPIRVLEDRICFDWFRLSEDNGAVDAYAQFIACLCETAKEKKRVTAKAPDSFENEKFAMRVWLIGLGMVGKKYALARKLLLKNLDGNSSWRYGAPGTANTIEAAQEADVAPNTAALNIPVEIPNEDTTPLKGGESEVRGDA